MDGDETIFCGSSQHVTFKPNSMLERRRGASSKWIADVYDAEHYRPLARHLLQLGIAGGSIEAAAWWFGSI
jgi:hypothetical protein